MKAIDVAKNADQVELNAFRNGYAVVSDGLTDEEISGEIEELVYRDTNTLEKWADEDTYRDTEEGLIKKELDNRVELLEELYPFEMRGSSLGYRNPKHETKVYESLLLTSLATRRQGKHWLELVSSFEKVSARAVREFFECDEMWWTGSDSHDAFKEKIDRIYKKTRELEWNPDPNIFDRHKKIKDAGVDFINYRYMLDQRVGGIFFYGQSACGDNWFSKTKTDIRAKELERIFRKPYADPIKLFTIPYLITSDDHRTMIRAASNFSGVIFDRARLTKLLVDAIQDVKVKKEIGNIFCLADKKCN